MTNFSSCRSRKCYFRDRQFEKLVTDLDLGYQEMCTSKINGLERVLIRGQTLEVPYLGRDGQKNSRGLSLAMAYLGRDGQKISGQKNIVAEVEN